MCLGVRGHMSEGGAHDAARGIILQSLIFNVISFVFIVLICVGGGIQYMCQNCTCADVFPVITLGSLPHPTSRNGMGISMAHDGCIDTLRSPTVHNIFQGVSIV